MAAGLRSTKTTTEWSSSTFRLPTTTPCWIHRRWISQTAWAIMGLLAANDTRSDCVAKGIANLLRTQKKDGYWDEPYYTGTGFPRVFYLMYHMYRQYFPLIALTTYKKVIAQEQGQN